MLLVIEVTLNALWIPFVCFGCVFVGFMLRQSQIGGLKKKILGLESEMLQNHAEILSLQKETIMLQDKLNNNTVPVIPITQKDQGDSSVDTNLRKKLLNKPVTSQHS